MRFHPLALFVVALLVAPPVAGQQPPIPPPPPDSARDSAHTESLPALPPPPTPEQTRYLDGLRSVGRGVSQLKGGLERLARAQSEHDTLRIRQAAQRLAGLCGAARTFMTHGRGGMNPAAYEDPARQPARKLVFQVDSLSLVVKECGLTAAKAPGPVATGLLTRIRAYEGALAAFRSATGLSR